MITIAELRTILALNNITTTLTDAQLTVLYNSIVNEIEAITDINITPQEYKEYVFSFSGVNLILNNYPISSITNLCINNTSINNSDYTLDSESGIIYFKTPLEGMMYIKYTAGLTENEINKYINPLIKEMFVYRLSSEYNNQVSTVKEGDVSVSYDTNYTRSSKIQGQLESLKNRFNCRTRML